MSFYFEAKESVENAAKRTVTEQIRKAVKEIDDGDIGLHETVHQIRKRCKKIRGVIRLVRPAFDDYSKENAIFRNAAREFSHIRDAQAHIETYDLLYGIFADQIDEASLAGVREALVERRDEITHNDSELDEKLTVFRKTMNKSIDRVKKWQLTASGFDALEPGFLKTYRRGREAMANAYNNPGVENFHEWRKRSKYHRYHIRLLRKIWKPVIMKTRDEVKRLTDYLGDDHDLAVFRDQLLTSPDDYGGERDVQFLLGLIDRHSAGLRAKAETQGARIFAEKPKHLGKRFRHYWSAWQKEISNTATTLNTSPAAVTA